MSEQKRPVRPVGEVAADAIRAMGRAPVEDMPATLSAAWRGACLCRALSVLLADDPDAPPEIHYAEGIEWAEAMERALLGSASLPADASRLSGACIEWDGDPVELVNAMLDLAGALNIVCGWAHTNATLAGDRTACATVAACSSELYRVYDPQG